MTRFLAAVAGLAAAGTAAAAAPDPADLARLVDRHLAARWEREGVRPAPPADDATFLRRASLDLLGRIPTAAEVRAFVADPAADKRDRLVDRLAAHPASAAHLSRVWCQRWLPQTSAQFDELRPEFEAWLRDQLRANAPYDRMARALLVAPGGPAGGRRGCSSRRTSTSRRIWRAARPGRSWG